jgi:hypothetical protein
VRLAGMAARAAEAVARAAELVGCCTSSRERGGQKV